MSRLIASRTKKKGKRTVYVECTQFRTFIATCKIDKEGERGLNGRLFHFNRVKTLSLVCAGERSARDEAGEWEEEGGWGEEGKREYIWIRQSYTRL